jgi:hypothetical protein
MRRKTSKFYSYLSFSANAAGRSSFTDNKERRKARFQVMEFVGTLVTGSCNLQMYKKTGL